VAGSDPIGSSGWSWPGLPLRDSVTRKPLSVGEIVDTAGNLAALGVSWLRTRPDHYTQPASTRADYFHLVEKISADLLPSICSIG
jgi:hypothetical protein